MNGAHVPRAATTEPATTEPATTKPVDIDLRLVPAALGAWAAALVALWVGWVAAAVLAAGGALITMLAAVAGKPAVVSGCVRPPRWWVRASAVLLAAGAATAAAALVAAVQAHRADTHPLRTAATSGAAATLRVRIADDPRPLRQPGYADRPGGAERYAVAAELQAASVAGTTWNGGGRMLLMAPAEGWNHLLPGQQVTAEGLLAPPTRDDLTVAVLRVRGPPTAVGPPPWWQRAAGDVRADLRQASGVLSEQPAGLLPSLVVGDTSGLPTTVVEEFRIAGLSHLTAVSGMNVAIVCGAVLGLLRLLRVGPRTSAVLAGVALVGFVVVARPSPSVLRAAVMGAITLLALVLGRGRSALPALAAAVLGLLLLDPELGVEPGFALSVLATAALVLLAPRWSASLRGRGVPAGVAEALTVPLAAHLVTAPLIAALSGQVSLVAVVANLLAAPAVAPATVFGALAAALGPLSAGAAELVVRLAGPFVGWLIAVGHHAAVLPGAALRWPAGSAGGLLLAAITVGTLALLRLRRLRTLAAAAVIGALIVLVPTRFVPPGWPATGWAVVACDVGQGDALAVATSEPGRAVVIDTGPDPGPVQGCLDRLGVRRVPLVVLSHLHADHIGGLAALLDDHAVGAVAVGRLHEPTWAFDQVRRLTDRAGVPLVQMQAGQRLQWPGLTIEVLGPRRPPQPLVEDDGTPVNNASLVLRADTVAGRVLLTGDIELAAQSELLGSGVDLRADVLKMPHHGSRFSSPDFLAAVRPRIALVSVGAGNRYRHPSSEILTALSAAGTTVVRTDQRGDIAVTGGPAGLAVVTRGHPGQPRGRVRTSGHMSSEFRHTLVRARPIRSMRGPAFKRPGRRPASRPRHPGIPGTVARR
jgi:competence protein ComEC